MIKVKERASITDLFMTTAKQLAAEQAGYIRNSIQSSPRYADRIRKENSQKILNIQAVLDEDRFRTSLRCLPYTSFAVVDDCLVGRTDPITITDGRRKQFSAGEYLVFVKKEWLLCGAARVHLIPVLEPRTEWRTPHHVVSSSNTGNPWTWRENTCLGSFASMLSALYNEFNLVEIFRTWHLYLSRYDEHSPLCRIERISHIKEIE